MTIVEKKNKRHKKRKEAAAAAGYNATSLATTLSLHSADRSLFVICVCSKIFLVAFIGGVKTSGPDFGAQK